MTRLILVPTRLELQRMQAARPGWPPQDARVELCGFGPILAAARTAQLIGVLQVSEVVLLGIAGAYAGRAEVGTAARFDSVACYGIGAGSGSDFVTAADMGWLQYEPFPPAGSALPASAVGDELDLTGETPRAARDAASPDAEDSSAAQLLTCCATAVCEADVAVRLARFPQAVAEDMEAFGVATACLLSETRLTVIRGFSNVAGNRDTRSWRIDAALNAARDLYERECG